MFSAGVLIGLIFLAFVFFVVENGDGCVKALMFIVLIAALLVAVFMFAVTSAAV